MGAAADEAPRRLIVAGAPGSGKGTQAALLAEELGVPAISTGDMLRQAIETGSDLGRRVQAIMERGELVDDATMAAVMRERLARGDAGEGFVLDGYPRTKAQARELERMLGENGSRIDAVVLIEVPREEMVRRALDRGRADDVDAVVRRRQEVYDEQTRPLMRYYRELGLLRPVDGHQGIQEVFADILRALSGEP